MGDYKIGINEIRELNQISLDTFLFDKENMFELSADSIIKKLINKAKEAEREHKELLRMEKFEPNRFRELEEEARRRDIDLQIQMVEYQTEEYYRNEELWALVEMKIIYHYKFFEINVKKLLKSSFPDSNSKDFFRWDMLMNFLKSKNINPKDINGYREVFLLKEVNNSLKHSDKIEKKLIEAVEEFKNVDKISYFELDLFYKRIRDYTDVFLKDLCSKIHDELYKFDDMKIKKIATKIALRMDKESADKLIGQIKSAY